MVICYFNIVDIALIPDKTNTPLVVYSDAVLPNTVVLQRFQPVSRWYPKIVQYLSIVQHTLFAPRYFLNVYPYPFSLVALEGFDHTSAYHNAIYIVNRYILVAVGCLVPDPASESGHDDDNCAATNDKNV